MINEQNKTTQTIQAQNVLALCSLVRTLLEMTVCSALDESSACVLVHGLI